MFGKYFYINKEGKLCIKNHVEFNLAQKMVVDKMMQKINEGLDIISQLDEIPLSVATAMGELAQAMLDANNKK